MNVVKISVIALMHANVTTCAVIRNRECYTMLLPIHLVNTKSI